MALFTYHLVNVSLLTAWRVLLFPPKVEKTPGLVHMETMYAMTLGSPILSPSRFLFRQLVVFAQWKSEADVEHYLNSTTLGQTLASGWHVRLRFLRQWGRISGFQLPTQAEPTYPDDAPVIAVTLARMRYFQVPRFIRWGRPTEQLVRDHPSTTLALASCHFPNLISTFSIWDSTTSMTNMVQGHSRVAQPKRHVNAMKERDRKDFHFEFTTLRFQPLTEFGTWNGKTNYSSNLTQTL